MEEVIQKLHSSHQYHKLYQARLDKKTTDEAKLIYLIRTLHSNYGTCEETVLLKSDNTFTIKRNGTHRSFNDLYNIFRFHIPTLTKECLAYCLLKEMKFLFCPDIKKITFSKKISKRNIKNIIFYTSFGDEFVKSVSNNPFYFQLFIWSLRHQNIEPTILDEVINANWYIIKSSEKDLQLPTLFDCQKFIDKNNHLQKLDWFTFYDFASSMRLVFQQRDILLSDRYLYLCLFLKDTCHIRFNTSKHMVEFKFASLVTQREGLFNISNNIFYKRGLDGMSIQTIDEIV
jgi:hypothetical protein